MKILVCDPTEETAISKIKNAGIHTDIDDDITQQELVEKIGDYDGIVVRSRTKVTAPIIDAAKKLRLIVRGGVGLDTIDATYARTKGISVFNTPLASSAAVAELTIGFIFALARAIPQATLSMKSGLWEKKKFEGNEISGKTLGIIGIGNIGKEVAWRALALGMIVQSYDPYAKPIAGVLSKSLDDLLSTSDYLTFHLPATNESRNMISKEQFQLMKEGIRIINCARGGIIEEDALFDALKNGKVAGAALDVFSTEPAVDNPLFTLSNVIGSPHIGASTKEAQARIGEEVAEIVIRFFKG